MRVRSATRASNVISSRRPSCRRRSCQAAHSSPAEGGAERAKPVRLIHRGRNGEIQHRARLVPDTAVIGSHDAEAIGLGRQVGVERLAAVAGFLPVAVLPSSL